MNYDFLTCLDSENANGIFDPYHWLTCIDVSYLWHNFSPFIDEDEGNIREFEKRFIHILEHEHIHAVLVELTNDEKVFHQFDNIADVVAYEG